MTDMELKPCPFCGGSVHQQGVDNVIKCDACGVTIDIPLSDKQEEAFEQGLVFDNWDIAHVARFWNTRAAVTTEQFARAVHDGRAWEPVRTCRMKPARGGGRYCSECGVWVAPGPMANATERLAPRYCPNCGAKVVE